MTGEEIISAQEAHDLTKETIDNDITCLIPIMNKIKEAAKKKEFGCYIKGSTPNYIIQKLQLLGYKIKFDNGDCMDPCSTSLYYVSW